MRQTIYPYTRLNKLTPILKTNMIYIKNLLSLIQLYSLQILALTSCKYFACFSIRPHIVIYCINIYIYMCTYLVQQDAIYLFKHYIYICMKWNICMD